MRDVWAQGRLLPVLHVWNAELANRQTRNLAINDLLAIVNAMSRGFLPRGVLVAGVEMPTLLTRCS